MDTYDIVSEIFEKLKMKLSKTKKEDMNGIIDEAMDEIMSGLTNKNKKMYEDLLKQMETVPCEM